jgi:hypothetical protein
LYLTGFKSQETLHCIYWVNKPHHISLAPQSSHESNISGYELRIDPKKVKGLMPRLVAARINKISELETPST